MAEAEKEKTYNVTYEITGYRDNTIQVRFTLGKVSEVLNFLYDGSKPIEEFLGEQATFATPGLKAKTLAEATKSEGLAKLLGKTGSVRVTEGDDPPPNPTKAFFKHSPH